LTIIVIVRPCRKSFWPKQGCKAVLYPPSPPVNAVRREGQHRSIRSGRCELPITRKSGEFQCPICFGEMYDPGLALALESQKAIHSSGTHRM